MNLFLKIILVVFFLGMIYINYYANTKPLGGISTGEISDKYDTLFTPSGFTFSIWGVIYLLLGVFVVVSVFQNTYFEPNPSIVVYLLLISMVLNGLWLFTWHFDRILLSTIVMIGFLVVLLFILKNIQSTDTLGNITFSVYSGWISVALIANISILITKYDLSIFMNNQWFWFITILIISLGIMLTMLIRTKNYFYCLVFIWAYFGILMKHLQK